MFEPTNVVVCARRAVCESPDTGAFDQYIPEAGAAWTSGAFAGSGRGGNDVCGPRGVFWWVVTTTFRSGAGAGTLDGIAALGFAAIADVERWFKGRGGFGGADGAVGVMVNRAGETGLSGLAACLVLLCTGGSFEEGDLDDEGEEDSFCVKDCERVRRLRSDCFFLRSWLLVDKWPGV